MKGSHNDHHVHLDPSTEDSGNDYDQFYIIMQDFEMDSYVYVWTFLLVITCFGNVLIVAVFFRKSMRTTTNLILLFIALSGFLTEFVTLPTYIHVLMSEKHGWVHLNERWCEAFMISKFYLSKAFHTVSVWQTLLLGFQRFSCVWFPLKTKSWFATRRTVTAVAVITICAFVIHTYHLNQRKADKNKGYCQWAIEDPCVETCIFLWMTLFLVNILPSLILLVLTILMIHKLFYRTIRIESFSAGQSRERAQQNKRASIIVVCIAIVFLFPELPYSIFQLVTVIKRQSGKDILSLRDNRACQITYELAVLLAFHANFWVCIIMNRRFRYELKLMFRDGIRKLLLKRTIVPITDVSMETNQSQSNSTKRTDVNTQSTIV